ncbi:hypothetical protein Cri9333_0219 [Crinalium epipsammum PCC 9333]|uniref:Uncharacterized protein n=1 Tax=Crinalium epipsammum PCC 9333 TaxID=1173022 RepID=K9VVL2_9CYAN|nr:hypothetical protein [Crinalium epipsammum]AFZ11215.1 hypothetical protein Cri9333_0219 [Crinalium epipsammum PCC 9333]
MNFLIFLLDAPVNFFSHPLHFEWTEMEQEALDISDQTSQQSKYLELELMMRPA